MCVVLGEVGPPSPSPLLFSKSMLITAVRSTGSGAGEIMGELLMLRISINRHFITKFGTGDEQHFDSFSHAARR